MTKKNIPNMSDNIFQKFRDKFFEEANMLLDRFENDILELEKSPDDRGLSESVFRAMHTIKGISAMYGFDYISEFTHLLENIFQNLNDGKIQFS
jgi:two-component system chemotaxis sensor kinase CheA